MGLEMELQDANLQRRFEDLRKFAKANLPNSVKNQSRLFTRDVVKLTPPLSKGVGMGWVNESFNEQRKAGEKAIEREVALVYTPLSALNIVAEAKKRNMEDAVKRLIRNRDCSGLEKLLTQVLPLVSTLKIRVFRQADAQFFEAFRQKSSGKVKGKRRPFFVIDASSIKKLIAAKKGHLGFAKAGWWKACSALGVPLPKWIGRHAAPSLFQDNTKSDKPNIIIGNKVGYIQKAGRELGIIRLALNNRKRAMRLQVEAICKKKTFKKGIN